MKAYITLKYFRASCMPPLDMKTACGWVGLEPEKIYENGIGFQSIVKDISHIEENINAIFNRVEPLKVNLSRILGIYNTQLSISVYHEGQVNQGIQINRDVLRKLSNWGGSVDIDICCDNNDLKD